MMTEHDAYVCKIDWLVRTGRDDLIDEIADQVERPSGLCASSVEHREDVPVQQPVRGEGRAAA